MEKIPLEIVGLSYSQTQNGAYALVLGEAGGKRRLPIIIGAFEAQAIAIELEKMKPSRPLTHDLFKTLADTYDVNVNEVVIYNLMEGIFYAKMVCEKDGVTTDIDARTSDAIALSVRFKCPVYTYDFILSSAGIILDDEIAKQNEDGTAPEELEITLPDIKAVSTKEKIDSMSKEDLNKALNKALADEDYERASRIRDELKKRA